MVVVVVDVLAQDDSGMTVVVDQESIGALCTRGAYPALGVAVGPSRRMHPMLLIRDELCG